MVDDIGRHLGKSSDQNSNQAVIEQKSATVETSLTIDSTHTAVNAGPITIGSSATVTVSGTWVIV